MINYQDQMNLFNVISKKIGKDIGCYAFGGNAMMFYGYKDETKDVDLYFDEEEDRDEFIKAIVSLGFSETSPIKIYIEEKLRDKHRPLMYKRDETRFDLFVKKIFHTVISPKMREDIFAVHEFKDRFNLKVKVLRKEFIVMLKAVTERDKDFEDILTIITKEKNFDWQYLTEETIWQFQNGDTWVLMDLEEVMKELQKDVFIEQKYLKMLYTAKSTEKELSKNKKSKKKHDKSVKK